MPAGKYFLDTNVLVYTFDASAADKQRRSKDLLRRARGTGQGIISYQVVQEFLSVATTRFKPELEPQHAKDYLEHVLIPLCDVHSSADLFRVAMTVREESGYSLWDALIVAAAMQSGCRTLYSEDLQDGRLFGSLAVRNPFAH